MDIGWSHGQGPHVGVGQRPASAGRRQWHPVHRRSIVVVSVHRPWDQGMEGEGLGYEYGSAWRLPAGEASGVGWHFMLRLIGEMRWHPMQGAYGNGNLLCPVESHALEGA
jgi:hypothetical protein